MSRSKPLTYSLPPFKIVHQFRVYQQAVIFSAFLYSRLLSSVLLHSTSTATYATTANLSVTAFLKRSPFFPHPTNTSFWLGRQYWQYSPSSARTFPTWYLRNANRNFQDVQIWSCSLFNQRCLIRALASCLTSVSHSCGCTKVARTNMAGHNTANLWLTASIEDIYGRLCFFGDLMRPNCHITPSLQAFVPPRLQQHDQSYNTSYTT